MANVRLENCCCFKLLASLADNSVDLIATDPPYYKVVDAEWDKQWSTKSDFMQWLEQVVIEYARVLKPTGSLYLFCNNYISSEVELMIAKHFRVLNHIVWRKPTGRFLGCNKESLRKYFPQTERIIFAESKKHNAFAYEPVRSYLHNAILEAGVTQKKVDELTGCQMSGHWFGKSQFSLPKEEHYQVLQSACPKLIKSYGELKAEFLELRKKQGRRYFRVTKQVPFTDVWDFKPVQYYEGKHPCEKPLNLMKHIIHSSCLDDGVVLDTFAGSASTAIACQELSRNFIGCELDPYIYNKAYGRIKSLFNNGESNGRFFKQ